MCQSCVDEGHLTAKELADRLGAGDQTVVAIVALEPAAFIDALVEMTLEVTTAGMDMGEALQIAFRVIGEYAKMRTDLDPADIAKALAEGL